MRKATSKAATALNAASQAIDKASLDAVVLDNLVQNANTAAKQEMLKPYAISKRDDISIKANLILVGTAAAAAFNELKAVQDLLKTFKEIYERKTLLKKIRVQNLPRLRRIWKKTGLELLPKTRLL